MKGFFLLFLFLPLVSALTFENGTSFGYEHVTFTWDDDEDLSSLEVLDAPRTAWLDENHSLSFVSNDSCALNITVFYWDRLNHSFAVSTPNICVVPYDIEVNGTDYFFKTEGAFKLTPLTLNSTVINWIYRLPSGLGSGGFGLFLLWLPMMMMFFMMILFIRSRKERLREEEK